MIGVIYDKNIMATVNIADMPIYNMMSLNINVIQFSLQSHIYSSYNFALVLSQVH